MSSMTNCDIAIIGGGSAALEAAIAARQAGADSVVMLEKYEELLVKSMMAKPADFDKVYDAALKDFMDTAGNEVFAERKAAYEAMK